MLDPEAQPLIGVCGPVGAGKSTVVRALAGALGFRPWLERVNDNLFFGRYVADPAAWAFRSQRAFLLGAAADADRARRCPPGGVLERPVQEMLGVFVRDLHHRGLIRDDELRILEQIVERNESVVGVPDVVVMLHADPLVLVERIGKRNQVGDTAYGVADMKRLGDAYDDWRAGWTGSPVLDVDTSERDLRLPTEIADLAAELRATLRRRGR